MHGEKAQAARELLIQFNPNLPEQMNAEILDWFAHTLVNANGSAAEVMRFNGPVGREFPNDAVILETTRKVTHKGFGAKTVHGDFADLDRAVDHHEDAYLIAQYTRERKSAADSRVFPQRSRSQVNLRARSR